MRSCVHVRICKCVRACARVRACVHACVCVTALVFIYMRVPVLKYICARWCLSECENESVQICKLVCIPLMSLNAYRYSEL